MANEATRARSWLKPNFSIRSVAESLRLTSDETQDLREKTLDWLNDRKPVEDVIRLVKGKEFATKHARLFLEKHGPMMFSSEAQGHYVWRDDRQDQQRHLIRSIAKIMYCQLYNKYDKKQRRVRKQQTEAVEDQTDESETASSTSEDTLADQDYLPTDIAFKSPSERRNCTRSEYRPGMPVLPSTERYSYDGGQIAWAETWAQSRKRNLLDIESALDGTPNSIRLGTTQHTPLLEASCTTAVLSTATDRPGPRAWTSVNNTSRSQVVPDSMLSVRSLGLNIPDDNHALASLVATADDQQIQRCESHHLSQNSTRSGLHTPVLTPIQRLTKRRDTDLVTDAPSSTEPHSPKDSDIFPLHIGGDQFKLVNRDCLAEVLQNVMDHLRSWEEECQRGSRQASNTQQRQTFELNRVFLRRKLRELYGKPELWLKEEVDDSTIVIS